MRTFEDVYTGRVRQVSHNRKSGHYAIREVIAGVPKKWQRLPKRSIAFILQDCIETTEL